MAAQREWFEKDYYAVLGVPATVTDKELTRAYRKLAKEFHPDTRPDDKAAEERFKEITAAYDVLNDAAKRKEYDEVRQLVAQGVRPNADGTFTGPYGGGGGPFGGPFTGAGGRTIRIEDLSDGDLSDLFSGMLGGFGQRFGSGGGGRSRRTSAPRKGQDVDASIDIDFVDAVDGITVPVRGTVEGEPYEVKVRVPAGVTDGQRIRVKERGLPSYTGGVRGDLYVRVNVRPHAWFGRSGDDLTVVVPISYTEAVLGASIKVPTLGEPVTIKVPPGSASGKTLRLRGRGLPRTKGEPSDLLVTFQVGVPSSVTSEERELLERLRVLDERDLRKGMV